jgi:hypothetical protein
VAVCFKHKAKLALKGKQCAWATCHFVRLLHLLSHTTTRQLPILPVWPRPAPPRPAQIIVAVAIAGERPAIPESAPPRLAEIIRRCWREDPRQRPTVREILRSLEALIQVGWAGVEERVDWAGLGVE